MSMTISICNNSGLSPLEYDSLIPHFHSQILLQDFFPGRRGIELFTHLSLENNSSSFISGRYSRTSPSLNPVTPNPIYIQR